MSFQCSPSIRWHPIQTEWPTNSREGRAGVSASLLGVSTSRDRDCESIDTPVTRTNGFFTSAHDSAMKPVQTRAAEFAAATSRPYQVPIALRPESQQRLWWLRGGRSPIWLFRISNLRSTFTAPIHRSTKSVRVAIDVFFSINIRPPLAFTRINKVYVERRGCGRVELTAGDKFEQAAIERCRRGRNRTAG